MDDRNAQPKTQPKPLPERSQPLPLAERLRFVRSKEPSEPKVHVFTDWASI